MFDCIKQTMNKFNPNPKSFLGEAGKLADHHNDYEVQSQTQSESESMSILRHIKSSIIS